MLDGKIAIITYVSADIDTKIAEIFAKHNAIVNCAVITADADWK